MAASSSSEESLASLCREAEQLKVKIDEEKQKVNDLQRKLLFINREGWVGVCHLLRCENEQRSLAFETRVDLLHQLLSRNMTLDCACDELSLVIILRLPFLMIL